MMPTITTLLRLADASALFAVGALCLAANVSAAILLKPPSRSSQPQG